MSNNFDLRRLFGVEGLVVVATGGDSGIGRMMARALAENGATVYSLDLRSKSLVSKDIRHCLDV
jgi:NAD(P)-dependent dehydrogenase (short-subunit alcohol dehydrogenase family)